MESEQEKKLQAEINLLKECIKILAKSTCNCDDGSEYYVGGHHGNCALSEVNDLLKQSETKPSTQAG